MKRRKVLIRIYCLAEKDTRTFFVCWLLLLLPLHTFSQAPQRDFNQIPIVIDQVNYDLDIISIKQDQQGYLWMTTREGLLKYDGYDFILYRNIPGDSTSIIDNNTESLLVDRKGALWIGTTKGLNRYDPGCDCFIRYPSNPGNPAPTGFITTITEDVSENLWIGMQDGGVFRYDPRSERFTRYLDDPAAPISVVGEIVRVMLADRQNNIWIGTGYGNYEDPGGLIRFDPKTGTATRYLHAPDNTNSLIDNRVSALMEDNKGRIWVGTYQNGLHLYDPIEDEIVRMGRNSVHPARLYPPPGHNVWQLSPFISILFQDRNGGYWIGTCGGGINYFEPGSDQATYFVYDHAKPNGISNDKLWSFFEDRSGQYWLGTLSQGGLHKMDPYSPQISRHRESNNSHVLSILESWAEPGMLYVGTVIHGLQRLDSKTGEMQPFFDKDVQERIFGGHSVHDIHQDPEGLLWLGLRDDNRQSPEPESAGSNGGLARLDPESGDFTQYGIPANNIPDLSIESVYRICEDRDGFLWLGAGEEGLFRFDKSTEMFKRFNLSGITSQSGSEIYLIEADSSGSLWVGDVAGTGTLFRYHMENETFEPFLEGYKPISFYQDSFGWYWVGTEHSGLLHFNSDLNSCFQYTSEDGLPGNKVVGILEGPPGTYWISTPRGISKFDPETNKFIARGLPSHRFEKANLKTSDGRMFFGGSSVLFSFYPDQVGGNQIPPEIIIKRIMVSGTTLDRENSAGQDSEEMVLAHSQNDLTFEYLGFHYSNPERNRYRYKLEPYDHSWIEAGTQRITQYTNLDPGAYTFRVIGANNNGVWNEEGARVQFLIKTAWWSRWWAYLLYLILFSSVIYAFYRFQLSRKLAVEEGKRQKQINQLKNNLFANISHEFRTPLTVILGITDSLESEINFKTSPSASQGIKMIRRNGRNLLKLVNEMLELTKLKSGHVQTNYSQINVVPFIKYLVESFNSYADKKGIDFTVCSETDELFMDLDARQLSSIISNLLSNAIKFTPPLGKIVLRIQNEEDKNLILEICDTGIGIPREDLPFIFNRYYQAHSTKNGNERSGTGIGLALTKEMVSGLGGRISVRSNPDEGSVFTVSLPITRKAPISGSQSCRLYPENSDDLAEEPVWGKAISVEQNLPLVLVVEDNMDVAYYIIQCLSGTYSTLYAPDGLIGLEMALEYVPDIVITDVMMPGKDGFELCGLLKKNELTDHIPIIMLTARVALKDRLFGLSQGADAYLRKPFVKEELLTRIEQLILVRKKLIRKFDKMGFGAFIQKSVTDPDTKFIQNVVAHIHENLSDESFGPGHLAINLALSESQVYRKLKAISGKSTAIFIRSVRLQKAKDLIVSTDMNISEIAYEAGFSNLAWFSRVFKQEFGSPPSALRK